MADRSQSRRPTDTPPEVERTLIEGYRRMSGAEKIQRVLDPNHTAETLAAPASAPAAAPT